MTPTFIKDPDAVLDYPINWTTWLNGDTLATSTWTVPAGITQSSVSSSTTIATIWLSGGTVGNAYLITNHITTTGGRADDRTIRIKIVQR